jgi:hypothetical protein
MPIGAHEASRPSQALQVRHARLLVGKELAELDEVAGVIDASTGLGLGRFDHDHSI